MGEQQTTPERGGQNRDISALKRVMIGRNIILTMGALYALSRSIYYATTSPETLSGAQEVITAYGGGLGVWSGLWGLVMVLCISDMVNAHTRHGLSLLVGITSAWGVGYLLIWGFTGFGDLTLLSSAVGWLAPAIFIFGFLIKVTALQDMIILPLESE